MTRTEELREKIEEKCRTFSIGDEIVFSLYDDAHCYESNGDAVEIEMIGKILSINGHKAVVEYKYGKALTWLPIAKKVMEK